MPTTGFWQTLEPPQDWQHRWTPPFRHAYPVAMPDGRVLALPIRQLPATPERPVASLIANKAAHEVIDQLVIGMASLARPLQADVVVGLPTLGMVFAPGVARALGHARYVPMGYSRKFWYDDALSTIVTSITTPPPGKRIYIDPNQLPLLSGRRVVIVDDVVSSATTLQAVWDLLEAQGVQVAGAVLAMRQGSAWRRALTPARQAKVFGVFDSPRLELRGDGWWPD